MSKSPRVVFQPKRITETDWQIEATIPCAEVRVISGLISKADVDDWMAGNRKVAWLRSQGYAKWPPRDPNQFAKSIIDSDGRKPPPLGRHPQLTKRFLLGLFAQTWVVGRQVNFGRQIG
jgi:hypothetical protein